ncbi:phosphoserine aminotransferase [Cantharellus anzutake]|uniref:phosphoserine aminotransferase n=1 Tax=Cantharellus anzutake TaxID=1750568 RepID=UPI001905672A|nr:phosphoserine aminotransferase [Cantharellus anzutake]KAF8338235.1 phosphoserine aminotransferase [Cantharellus anzutake]
MQREEIINLAAGPSTLPQSVLQEAAQGLLNYEGTGIGLTELSHRSPDFTKLTTDLENILRKHLNVPQTHRVLFTQGGGSLQFSAVVMNLLSRHRRLYPDLPEKDRVMDYVVTGNWSSKAIEEAKKLAGPCTVHTVFDGREHSADRKFQAISAAENWKISNNPAFVYYCDNETVDGVQFDGYLSKEGENNERIRFPFHALPRDPSNPTNLVPIVADYSSSFFTRPIPQIEDHAVVFAGAQKNVGPAGLTILLVRQDVLVPQPTNSLYPIPTTLEYATLAKSGSLYNTPPMFSMYVSLLIMRHYESKGGLSAVVAESKIKVEKLYRSLEVGEKKGVFKLRVKDGSRSYMNVTFEVLGEGNEAKFLKEATEKGLRGVKGHRSVGGIRISLYNGVTIEQVDKVVQFVLEFVEKNAS